MSKYNTKPGDTFNFWTVVGEEYKDARSNVWALCRCRCGKERPVRLTTLSHGDSLSCGCIRRTKSPSVGANAKAEIVVWHQMIDRCNNPDSQYYHNYGGRGIKVCQRWLESFAAFLEDMGRRPKGYTVERADNEKGYEPGNCKWATRLEQNNNTRANVRRTYQGVEYTLAEFSRKFNISHQKVTYHVRKGRSLETILLHVNGKRAKIPRG